MKIYWGITATRSYTNTIPHNESVIISACGLWNGRYFRNKKLYWPDWVLDSGGFSALNIWGDYPFTPDDYLYLIEERSPSWAASMDYPCEPDISKGTKLLTEDRIIATVELAKYLIRRDDRIVPVIQGYTIEEYEYCWKLLNNEINVKRVAIGSVCKRQSSSEIATLCWQLSQFIPDIPVHGFGVKLTALKYPEVWNLFSSIDTNAWEYKTRREKLTDSVAFSQYREAMMNRINADRQLTLGDRSC